MTVLEFLRKKGFSRHILSSMKADKEALTRNGQRIGGREKLLAGDYFRVRLLETVDSNGIVPVSMPLSILYEDEDILVINKPADMPVHPSIGTQMRNRQIRRTYLAVVEGITLPNGTISAPIGRVNDSVIERHVDFLHGESAVTHYERLEVKNEHSLLEIHLETGRTHQIRVHMGYIGHPLPADYLYHPVYDQFRRQPLHSLQLEFRHPVTDKPMYLLAPVPEDMCNAF